MSDEEFISVWSGSHGIPSSPPMLDTIQISISNFSDHNDSVFIPNTGHRCLVSIANEFRETIAPKLRASRLENIISFLAYLVRKYQSHSVACHSESHHRQVVVSSLLKYVDQKFLLSRDIHNQAAILGGGRRQEVLRNYYDAVQFVGNDRMHIIPPVALWRQAAAGKLRIAAVWGGQGPENASCLRTLRELQRTYGALIKDFLESWNQRLQQLTQEPDTAPYFSQHPFDLIRWLDDPTTQPGTPFLSAAPVSFPLNGMVGLLNYALLCRITYLDPGKMRSCFTAATGHSQGAILAAVVAAADSWDRLHDLALDAMSLLFWIGWECHHAMPSYSLSAQQVADCLAQNDGEPSWMLSIIGLPVPRVKEVIEMTSRMIQRNHPAELAIVHGLDSVVVSGNPRVLYGLIQQLRHMSSAADQSRIPYTSRKPSIKIQFLPISAPFHSSMLTIAVHCVLNRVFGMDWSVADAPFPVYHTHDSADLRQVQEPLITLLVRMVTVERVDWPKVSEFLGATHIVDFGPGRTTTLLSRAKKGAGTRIVTAAGSLSTLPDDAHQFAPDLFSYDIDQAHQLLEASDNWQASFAPRLQRTPTGALRIENRFTRFFKLPPLMVAAMTPTTMHWDVVSSIANAGYHTELAAGGFATPAALETCLRKTLHHIPPGYGLTVNVIYSNPRAVAWQIAIIKQIIHEGGAIHGLAIGAGVPSLSVALEYIETLSLRYLAFKPGSVNAIHAVIDIARHKPNFPIIIQWTGGRGGGHHSYEDFHAPILETYEKIRQCENIILVAGSGFGNAIDSWPYLSGDWTSVYGRPAMPFDAILLGSRIMVAKEAHTSPAAKQEIISTPGCTDDAWTGTYTGSTGGVVTVQSEMGQPIHILATRGALLWAELDATVFALESSLRVDYLARHKDSLINRLNTDFQKPWFGQVDGKPADLLDMTYADILQRLIQLMYIPQAARWIDNSYRNIVSDFVRRIQARFAAGRTAPHLSLMATLDNDPMTYSPHLTQEYPAIAMQTISPPDEAFFLGICRIPGRKPVNFVPALDENFETWFKKDSLWQSENLDALHDGDPQRTCILHGPVAAQYSHTINEPVAAILDGIHDEWITILRTKPKLHLPCPAVPSLDLLPVYVQILPGSDLYLDFSSPDLPDAQQIYSLLANFLPDWARTVLSSPLSVIRGSTQIANPFPIFFRPEPDCILRVHKFDSPDSAVLRLMRKPSTPDGKERILTQATCVDGQLIALDVWEFASASPGPALLHLEYLLQRTLYGEALHADIASHLACTRELYAQLWLGRGHANVEAHSPFSHCTILTTKTVQRLRLALGARSQINWKDNKMAIQLDIVTLLAWKSLVQPLVDIDFGADLSQLVHKSHTVRYLNSAAYLHLHDRLDVVSKVRSVQIVSSGKTVEVRATIFRQNKAILEIDAIFHLRGTFSDYHQTFQQHEEPVHHLLVDTSQLARRLQRQSWLQFHDKAGPAVADELIFELQTYKTFHDETRARSIFVTGRIYRHTSTGRGQRVGSVDYHLEKLGMADFNPVLNFLKQWTTSQSTAVFLPSPIPIANNLHFTIPHDHNQYANASGDFNPIHLSASFAEYAGFPGPIAHGMYTAARVRYAVEQLLCADEPSRFRSYHANFAKAVRAGDKIELQLDHIAMTQGRKIIAIRALDVESKSTVLHAEAEIEEPRTAYIFTGQGSQHLDMGMQLFDSSASARAVWNRADKFSMHHFGWSILDIVRSNPKSITIHFGTSQGRAIRSRYLSLEMEAVASQYSPSSVTALRDLSPDAESYTFKLPKGALFSSTFIQPVMITMQFALFEDLQARGLVPEGCRYAGHSLGEYAALLALARFMSLESAITVSFSRGLIMQAAMQANQSENDTFGMVAVNPSRIKTKFGTDTLQATVDEVGFQCNNLLEIVNYNVQGQQYVCAGHTLCLYVLTEVMDRIASSPDLAASSISTWIAESLAASKKIAVPPPLRRGLATIPLAGIDTPFHSSYLKDGVGTFRKLLRQHIQPDDIQIDKLVGRYVPNLTAKPFSLSVEYIEHTAMVTGSPALVEMLAKMRSHTVCNDNGTS